MKINRETKWSTEILFSKSDTKFVFTLDSYADLTVYINKPGYVDFLVVGDTNDLDSLIESLLELRKASKE